MRDDPWQSARDEFKNQILPYLQEHGKTIGQEANSGNETAQKIIHYYKMLHRSFDPMTLVLIQEQIKLR